MIRLQLMGSAELTRGDGTSVASVLAQPKRFALLAYLAVASPGRFCRRDRLLALCWPEKDQTHARNALRQSLHYLRRSLGKELIESRGDDEVRVDPDRIAVDVLEFETLMQAGEPAEALKRYHGPFMDGFHLPDAPELERWFDEERTRLSRLAWNAAMEAVESAQEPTARLAYAQTAVRIRPTNDVSVRALMAALDGVGDREGALAAYEHLAQQCRELHDSGPAAETRELADLVRRGARAETPDAPRATSSEPDVERQERRNGKTSADQVAPGGMGSHSAFLALAAVVATISLTGVVLWPRTPAPMEVFESPFREGQRPTALGTGDFSLSSDGTRLVYVGPAEGDGTRLWTRRWSDTEATPIPGTEGAGKPSISPDGLQVAYSQNYAIKVISLDGGEALAVTSGVSPRWGPDGLLYAWTFRPGEVIRVPSTGGVAVPVTERAEGEVARWLTDVLPNGWALLWVQFIANLPDEIWAIDLTSGDTKRLVQGSSPRFVAETGSLLYLASDGRLVAAPLKLGPMEMGGAPVPVVSGRVTGFSVSEEGRLFYAVDSRAARDPDEMVWMNRSGNATPLGLTFAHAGVFYFGWSLSPDGDRLAFTRRRDRNDDIWVKHLPDGAAERLTLDDGPDSQPFWTPDGETVTYLAASGNFRSVWSARHHSNDERQLVYAEDRNFTAGAWSPDGRWLALETRDGPREADIVGLRPGIDSAAVPLLASAAAERSPAFSPDGQWLAYSSNRTGRPEIYVRPFPNVDSASVLVSTGGGIVPVWAHSGRELFFMDAGRSLVSARIRTTSGLRVTSVDKLFTIPNEVHVNYSGLSRFFDVSIDDQRFVMGRTAPRDDDPTAVRTFLVTNFFEAIRRERP